MDYEFQNLLNDMTEMVIIEDAVGKITFANQAYCNCFGISVEEIVGKSVFDFIIPDDWERTNVEKIVSPKNPSYRIEGRSKRADGELIWIQYIGKAFFDENGNRTGFQEIGVDITELKEKILEISDELNKANVKIAEYYSKLPKVGGNSENINEKNFNAIHRFEDIYTENPRMKLLVAYAQGIAKCDVPVLIEGESGTGKELFAQGIHNESKRSNGPFVPINCGAIPPELVESEFFGYAAGAFTGASKGGKAGKFEQASGGTLFLDEIGEMPIAQQIALLRVLETNTVNRIGGDKAIPVDVRVICATNKDLYKEVVENKFRSDLYFRLNVINLKIPPLRERKEDIDFILRKWIKENSPSVLMDESDIVLEMKVNFSNYEWPGNVRELKNVFDRILYSPKGWEREFINITKKELENNNENENGAHFTNEVKGKEEIQNEQEVIENLFEKYENNISMIARKMGISRNTLYKKMKKYKIDVKNKLVLKDAENKKSEQ